jgi:hypothetical protein
MKHPYYLLLALCAMMLFSTRAAHGQTAVDIEQLLDTKEITCSRAAYFVLAAAMENPPPNPEAAFTLARENGWFPEKAESDNSITLGGLSLLMMKAFNPRLTQTGGLMFRLFPGSRYAHRAMANRGFIEGRTCPGQNVSGGQLLRILEKVLSGEGTEQ